MIRNVMITIAIALLTAGTVPAQEKMEQQESGLVSWLRSVQKKIDIVNPRKTPPVTTGVAGVRGSREDGRAKLYWKGKKGEEQVSEEELAGFKAAIELARNGDNAAAAKELERFLQQYPDSALVPDAKKTLDLVKAEGTASAPAK